MLPGAAGTIGPHFERELLFLGDAEAEPHEKQGFASQAEHFLHSQRARVYGERFDQRLPRPAALLVVAHGEASDFRELGAIDLETPCADDAAVRAGGGRQSHDILLDVPAEIVVRARQEITGRYERRHQCLHRGDIRKRRRAQRGFRLGSAAWLDRQAGHANTSSRMVTPRSSSSRVIVSGGTMRITVGPAVRTSRCRSRAAATTGAATSLSSSPHISPRPRASRTREVPATRRFNRVPNHSPFARTAARKSGSAIVRSTSRATVATKGPPPNVVAWSPGASDAAIASFTRIAPIGSPPPSGFASVYMSGTTPDASEANKVPVRPRPHCTSSKINAVPVSLHRFRKKTRNSSATGRTPPSPCTGSMMTAAVRSGVMVRSAASTSPSGMMCTSASSGSKGRR